MAKLHCNNINCRYYDDMNCTADHVYYVDRLCVTFRKRRHGENYRELMKSNVGICKREHGALRRKGN